MPNTVKEPILCLQVTNNQQKDIQLKAENILVDEVPVSGYKNDIIKTGEQNNFLIILGEESFYENGINSEKIKAVTVELKFRNVNSLLLYIHLGIVTVQV